MTESANFRNVISIPQAKHYFGRGNYINDALYLVDKIKGSNLPQNFKQAKCIVILFCEKGGFKYDSKGSTIYASQNDLVFSQMDKTFLTCKPYPTLILGKPSSSVPIHSPV